MKSSVFTVDEKTNKLFFIDALRAIAILLVVLHHVGEIFKEAYLIRIVSPFGKYGVQLFFVMSAFTMCFTTYGKDSSFNNIKSFYTKRLFRIAPLYLLAIPFYMCIAFLSSILNTHSITKIENYNFVNILSNVFFVHGFYPNGNNSIVPGGWSIGCEMIFYLIFPVLLYYSKKSIYYLLIPQVLSWIAIFGLLYVAVLFGHKGEGGGSSFAYYFIANQMSTFLLGIMLFFLWKSRTFFNVIQCSSVISLALLIFLNNKYSWLITPLFAGILSVYLALIIKKIKFPSFFYKIGQMSFSIYLIHFFFVWLAEIFIYKFSYYIEVNTLGIILFIIVVLASFFTAKITYSYIELPMIKLGKKFLGVKKNYIN
jgi:peptidoglycan/LPS O-acetylase OafA/YrhL